LKVFFKAMTAKLIITPGGEKLAILPADEFEDLCDQLAHAQAMADYYAGRDKALTLEEVDALMAADAGRLLKREARHDAGETGRRGREDAASHRRSRIAKALRVKLGELDPAE
jgi:hypothetical protein